MTALLLLFKVMSSILHSGKNFKVCCASLFLSKVKNHLHMGIGHLVPEAILGTTAPWPNGQGVGHIYCMYIDIFTHMHVMYVHTHIYIYIYIYIC